MSTDKQSKKVISRYSLLLVGYKHWNDIKTTMKETFNSDRADNKDSVTSILILKEGKYNYPNI